MTGLLLTLLVAQADLAVTKQNCHRWEAPEWAPWDMKGLGGRDLGAPRPPLTFLDRAIVPHERGVLWLTKDGDRWGYVGWREDLDASKDWLYRDGRTGVAELPETAVDGYLDAIRQNNPENAEKRCSHRAWAEGPFPLRTVFRNTRKAGADLRRLAFSQRNRRAYALLKVTQQGAIKGEFFVLVEKRGRGWLLTGVTEKREHAQAFVEAQGAFSPATAAALRDELVKAFSQRRSWRVERLALGGFREGLMELYRQGPLAEAELVAEEKKAAFGELVFVKHRFGWRVSGRRE